MAVARHHVLLSPGFLRGSWRQSGGKVGVAGGVQGAGVVPLGVVAEEWAESRVILKNVYFFQYTTFDNVYIFQHELSLGDSVARNRGCRERAGNNYVSYEVAPTFARGLIDVIHSLQLYKAPKQPVAYDSVWPPSSRRALSRIACSSNWCLF